MSSNLIVLGDKTSHDSVVIGAAPGSEVESFFERDRAARQNVPDLMRRHADVDT